MTRGTRSSTKKDERKDEQPPSNPKTQSKSQSKRQPSPQSKRQPSPQSERKPSPKSKREPSPQSQPSKKVKQDKPLPNKKAKEAKEEKVELKKMTMSGTVPVDPHFTRASNGKVAQVGGVVYAATLNQSNIANNNNKFYILQIIEVGTSEWWFFCRWGRVGVVGQTSQMLCGNIHTAIRAYEQKLREKTKSGSYTLVEMNYEGGEDEAEAQQKKNEAKKEEEVESQLPKKVQDLIRLIFDMKMMNNQMKEIGYDAKKMPLGRLSKSSIEKGYEALKKLSEEVKGQKRKEKFQEYSSDFYSNIPHDFGFIKMQNFTLDTERKIKEKLEMLQSLQDIQIYTKILSEGKLMTDINEIDSNYLRLKTTIEPIDHHSDLYRRLVAYVENTHAATHNNFRIEVEDIFRMDKPQETSRYKAHIGNHQLLWHGSRLTNFVGILSQGLRIAPPEAPVTGYMFGKGVYFADMVSKSANYCCTSKTNNTGLMLLCEVALGNMNQKFSADYYASNLPPGKDSTKGVGRTAPSGGEYIQSAWAPNQLVASTNVPHTSLLYNEFIVYDVAQIKSKFLFKMKFHYN